MAVCLRKSLEAGSRRCLLAELALVSCFPQIQSVRARETDRLVHHVAIQFMVRHVCVSILCIQC